LLIESSQQSQVFSSVVSMFTNTSLSDSNVLLYKAERLLVESSKQFHFCPENPLSIFLLRILSAISGIYIFFGFHVYKYIITRFLLLPNTRQNVSSLNPPNILSFFVVVIHLHYNQIRIFCLARRNVCLLNPLGDRIFFASFPCSQIY